MPLDVIYFVIVFIAMIVFLIIAEIKDLQNMDLKRELEYYKSTTKRFCICEEVHQQEIMDLVQYNNLLERQVEEYRQHCDACENTNKICKNCAYHYDNKCLMNIGVWRDDNYCSLWKNK